MTDYTLLITIACPEALRTDAGALAVVLGETASDVLSFAHAAEWQDAGGSKYVVVSTPVRPTFPGRASSPLTAPAHAPDADPMAMMEPSGIGIPD